MTHSIPIPPEHLSFFFLRKAAIVQQWGQPIHTKTPEWGKRVKMPRGKRYAFFKEAKNRILAGST